MTYTWTLIWTIRISYFLRINWFRRTYDPNQANQYQWHETEPSGINLFPMDLNLRGCKNKPKLRKDQNQVEKQNNKNKWLSGINKAWVHDIPRKYELHEPLKLTVLLISSLLQPKEDCSECYCNPCNSIKNAWDQNIRSE